MRSRGRGRMGIGRMWLVAWKSDRLGPIGFRPGVRMLVLNRLRLNKIAKAVTNTQRKLIRLYDNYMPKTYNNTGAQTANKVKN